MKQGKKSFNNKINLSISNGIWAHNLLICKRKPNQSNDWAVLRILIESWYHLNFRYCTFFEIQATIGFRFTLKCVHEMIITYSQNQSTLKELLWLYWEKTWKMYRRWRGGSFFNTGADKPLKLADFDSTKDPITWSCKKSKT